MIVTKNPTCSCLAWNRVLAGLPWTRSYTLTAHKQAIYINVSSIIEPNSLIFPSIPQYIAMSVHSSEIGLCCYRFRERERVQLALFPFTFMGNITIIYNHNGQYNLTGIATWPFTTRNLTLNRFWICLIRFWHQSAVLSDQIKSTRKQCWRRKNDCEGRKLMLWG